MTDKELLELAAKAAGAPAYWSDDGTVQQRPMFVVLAGGGMGTMPYEAEWNPLKDDALALRLAVKLGFEIDVGRERVAVRTPKGNKVLLGGTDPYAATRRAITRAAAEIGKSMETQDD